MADYNLKKKDQLGMSLGKANNILKKSIMFMLARKCNMDTCYRCGEKILAVDEFSVEHMENWLDSENPQELFFNLDNISFSHYNCNVGARRKTPRKSAYSKEEAKIKKNEYNKEYNKKRQKTAEYREWNKLYMRSRREDPDFRKYQNEISRKSYYKNKKK